MAIEVPDLNDMMDMRSQLTPKTGFNVVGIDWFDYTPYLIGHCETLAEAEALRKKKPKQDGDKVMIWEAEKK